MSALRRRLHRTITAFAMMVAMLFSQLALAQYLCRSEQATDIAVQAGHAGHGGHGGHDNCAERAAQAADTLCDDAADVAQDALCYQHFASPVQSFQVLNAVAPTVPALVQVVALAMRPDSADQLELPRALAPEGQPPSNPVFLSTLRLRV